MTDRTSLTLIAYHEAGHIIAAHAFGVVVTSVSWPPTAAGAARDRPLR
jgi:hypothetical protein